MIRFIGQSIPVAVILYAGYNIVNAKFTGPQLTVTLKDPFQPSFKSRSASSSTSYESSVSQSSLMCDLQDSIYNLDPCLSWVFQSDSPPLGVMLPCLQSVSASVGYQYKKLRKYPSIIKMNLRCGPFADGRVGIQVEPSFHVKERKSDVTVRVAAGRGFGGLIKIGNRGKALIDFVRTSHKISLPFSALSGVRITPSFDAIRSAPSCLIEGETGNGRTIAMVDLNIENPTLAVTHAIDERNIISPEISLHTAKIMYRWDINLDSGSIRTKVDPTSAIHVTWTDKTKSGSWITDFKLPLADSQGPLSADIKVKRNFIF